MRQILTSGLLWFSAVGCGLMAGVYFAFSTFIMTALGRLDQAAGIAAMNAIMSTSCAPCSCRCSSAPRWRERHWW